MCTGNIVEENETEGKMKFEEFKKERRIPAAKEVTDQGCQRLMKVGAYFKPYHGLTFISMLPPDAQETWIVSFSRFSKVSPRPLREGSRKPGTDTICTFKCGDSTSVFLKKPI